MGSSSWGRTANAAVSAVVGRRRRGPRVPAGRSASGWPNAPSNSGGMRVGRAAPVQQHPIHVGPGHEHAVAVRELRAPAGPDAPGAHRPGSCRSARPRPGPAGGRRPRPPGPARRGHAGRTRPGRSRAGPSGTRPGPGRSAAGWRSAGGHRVRPRRSGSGTAAEQRPGSRRRWSRHLAGPRRSSSVSSVTMAVPSRGAVWRSSRTSHERAASNDHEPDAQRSRPRRRRGTGHRRADGGRRR